MSIAAKILSGICVLIFFFILLPINISGQESPALSEEAGVEREIEPIEALPCETYRMESKAKLVEEIEAEEETSGELSVKPADLVLEDADEVGQAESEKLTAQGQSSWQNIMTEGFEGAFPGDWDLWIPSGATDAYWGKDNYRAHSGSHSAFCAKSGLAGVDPPTDYPNNMQAWMIYGPFSLADATDAEVDYYFWLDSEYDYDFLSCLASIDGTHFYGYDWTGYTDGWVADSFDLTNVDTLGNVCGQSNVWIAFVFESDYAVSYGGAFIDDIELRRYVAGALLHIDSLSPNEGPVDARVIVSGSDFGSSQGASTVTFGEVNADVSSWSDAEIVAWVPEGAGSTLVVHTSQGDSNAVSFTVTDSPVDYWAVIVGVADYPGTENDLPFPDEDAWDVYDALLAYPNWEEGHITMLLNSDATKANIHNAITQMGNNGDGNDLFFFQYSGHGGNAADQPPIDETDGLDEYLAPYDFATDLIWDDEFAEWFADLPGRKVAVSLDACHSGGQVRASGEGVVRCVAAEGIPARSDDFVRDIDDITGGVALAASAEDEGSWDVQDLQNGLYTYYFVEGLGGPADSNADDQISMEEAFNYLDPLVSSYPVSEPQNPQMYDGYPGELVILLSELNNSPNTPANPSPADQDTGVPIYADLSWTGGDPDAGDTVTYDVYFGTSATPPLASNDQAATTYDPETLSYDTQYYWKIVATDDHGAFTEGPLWDFTTGVELNTPPEVTGVTASQSSPTVDITYDVSDAEQSDVTISFEYWDGSSWQACITTTGEGTQSTGTGKSGTWDAKADFDEHYMTDCKIKVTADDEQAENNTGTGESSSFTLDTKDPTSYGCSSPANGATDVSVNPNLTCSTASDDSPPVSYYFQLAENDIFEQGLQESVWQSSTTWSPPTLDHDKQYFWRVKAKDSYGNETDYSATFDFTTQTGGGNPQIEWLHWNGQLAAVYTYEGGVLVMVSNYAYFHNAGGSGTVNFEARIVRRYDGNIMTTRSDSFSVESGQNYRLTIPISPVGSEEPVGEWYDLSVISPSATSDFTRILGFEHYYENAVIHPMVLITYTNTPPNAPASPLCEGMTNPTDVFDPTPDFSWTFSDPNDVDSQGAYQVLVASTSENLASDIGDMWDTGKVNLFDGMVSEVSYAGISLIQGQTYYWKVKTWDSNGNEGPYCAEQQFTMSTAEAEVWVDDDWAGSNIGDPVGGHTFGVDAFATIQDGIDAVAGSIVHVAAGTYYENITLRDGVELLGAGAGVTTIDGGGSGSVVTASNADPTTRLDGFTITNGSAYDGGGMYNDESSPTVTNCTFSGNSANDDGGGMYNDYKSSPTVINCTFYGNSADRGGGMYNIGSPTVANCIFSGNSADRGGGMYNNDSSPTVTDCTFYDNSAEYEGGGMSNDFNSSPTVTNCNFYGNSADRGGGMYNSDSSPTVTNCTFYDNSAEYEGGGLYNVFDSSPTIINNIISNNTASYGGGGIDASSSSPIIDYNNVWNNSPEDYYGCSAGAHDISDDPRFVAPGTGNFHLQPDSPCVDTGDNTAVPGWLTTDFEGDPRIYDGDGDTVAVVDMGADEYTPPPDIRTPIDHISFGDVYVGNSLDETTTIYNDGSTYLIIDAVTRDSGSAEFSYVGPATPFSIAAGQSQAITIKFAPTSAGEKNATFNVNSNDPDEPDVTFDVSGNGENIVEIQLSLQAGWNMVSIPVTPTEGATSAVFPGVAGIFAWNATSRSYYEPTVIEPEKGYWVAVTENTTVSINGTPIETWTTDIGEGWNMIGSVATNSSIADPNDDPDSSVIPPAYWWDPVERKYIETTDIEPGKGYWVASINDCKLTLP